MKIGRIGLCALTASLASAVFLSAGPSTATSQDNDGTPIDQIDLEGIYFGVQVTQTPNQPPSPACVSAGYTKYLKFDATTAQGKVWASTLTAALLAGKQIGYRGSNTCVGGAANKQAEQLTQFWVYQ